MDMRPCCMYRKLRLELPAHLAPLVCAPALLLGTYMPGKACSKPPAMQRPACLPAALQELASTRTRTQLELETKDAELRNARGQLAAAMANLEQHVSEARTAAEQEWRAEVRSGVQLQLCVMLRVWRMQRRALSCLLPE